MIYDDGSSLEIAADGTTTAYDTSGQLYSTVADSGGYTPGPAYYQDRAEQQRLGGFYPPNKPWWEGVAQYGLSRAIDAKWGPTITGGNAPGSFAGANGRTYTQGRGQGDMSNNNLMLLVLAGLAIYAVAG